MKRWGEGESKYLKSSDLLKPGGDYSTVNATIEALTIEAVGEDKEDKFILYFKGAQKGMVLNTTNENMLSDLFGVPADPTNPDVVTAHFRGKRVQIYFDPSVSFGNKRVGGIRLRSVQANSGRTPAPPPPPPAEESWDDSSESEPPF